MSEHAMRVISMGQALMRKVAVTFGCRDLDDFSTASESGIDPDSLKSGTSVFTSVSAQVKQIRDMHADLLRADRMQVQEATLIDVLKEADPSLAERFLELYEERLGGNALDEPSESPKKGRR
jgi:hypothetical protein